METCYLMSWVNDKDAISSAFSPERVATGNDLIKTLDGKKELPFELALKKLEIVEGHLVQSDDLAGVTNVWRDYQPNSRAWPLMSDKLRTVVEDNLTGDETVDWISCRISGGAENKSYFIPRFNKLHDVLDNNQTSFVKNTGLVIRPVFAGSKIRNLPMFSKPALYDLWKITSSIYVTETLRSAIQKAKCTGVVFEKARTS